MIHAIGLLIARSVDEEANLLLVLKTSAGKDVVQALLASLEILLAAHATDAVPQGSGNAASASGKHDLTSRTIQAADCADVVASKGSTYVIWKSTLRLSRPRTRLQRPAIYFTANLTISAQALTSSKQDAKDYLKPYEPLPANVLEPLQFDPAFSVSKIHLSETRITKVAPAAARSDDTKPVRGASKRAFPIVPALFTKIRYSALPDAVVASLHIETSQVVSGSVLIKDVSLDVQDAQVHSLCSSDMTKETHGGDETVLLFKLIHKAQNPASTVSIVQVSIQATVTIEQGSQIDLDIKWQAQVDLSQTASKPTYKWSRPLSASTQHQSLPSLPAGEKPLPSDTTADVRSSTAGITFNFSAPHTTTRNENFKLHVQCLNRSSRQRRFALVAIQPKTQTTTRIQQSADTADSDLIANIFNAPQLERQKPPDVLSLDPDVRVGPLPSGACFEAHMSFRAVAAGVLDLGIIRIVDLDSRQTVDVRELPDVIALEKLEVES